MMGDPRGRMGCDGASECFSDATAHENATSRLLLTVDNVAHLLSINRSTVYDMLGRGDLPSVKIGRRRLISRQALIDFISRSEHEGSSP